MRPVITAFDWVPDFARGLVRDLRVRWALEEVGRAYDVRYLSQGAQKDDAHRALQPFGQVPTFQDGALTLFESGAIVLLVAEGTPLLPDAPDARARAIEWMFAALNTIEPPIADRANMLVFERGEAWAGSRLPVTELRVEQRLAELARRLGDGPWLDGERFTAGDLLMVAVLRMLGDSELLARHETLARYVDRGEARPAFARALDAHLAGFTGEAPAGFKRWLEKGGTR